MKKILDFNILHLLTIVLLMTGVGSTFSACADEEKGSNAPAVKKTTSTYNTASFEWTAVSGASEYAYRLVCDNDKKEVIKAKTSDTKATFSNLAATKTYYLYVSAIVGGTPTEEGRAAASTGFDIPQPAASMTVRLKEGEILNVKLAWSASGAQKFGYTLDAAAEVITDKTSLELPASITVTEHTFKMRSISEDPMFKNSAVKTYTFTPTGTIYNGVLANPTLNLTEQKVLVEAWRFLKADGKDADKYKIDVKDLLGKSFTYTSTLVKDATSYVIVPTGVAEIEVDGKLIGYDFGTIDGKPICVTSITVDKGFTAVTVNCTYDAERKKKLTIKVPLIAKKKNADKNEL